MPRSARATRRWPSTPPRTDRTSHALTPPADHRSATPVYYTEPDPDVEGECCVREYRAGQFVHERSCPWAGGR